MFAFAKIAAREAASYPIPSPGGPAGPGGPLKQLIKKISFFSFFFI